MDAFIENEILLLWQEGYELSDVREAIKRILNQQKKAIQLKNMQDILHGKYHDIDDMRQRMPLCTVILNDGTRYETNIPGKVQNWVIFLRKIESRQYGFIKSTG